jgi:magnesium transporter
VPGVERFLYFSRILGLPVLDPGGARVGRLADLVVAAEERYPRVRAVAVRAEGREVDLPWSAVAALDDAVRLAAEGAAALAVPGAGAGSAGAADGLPNGAPRAIRLRRDLLDRQIVDTEGAKVVRVNDLHLLQSDRTLLLVHVDVGFRGLLRRLGWERAVDGAVRLFRRGGPGLDDRLIGWSYVQPLATPGGGALQLTVRQTQLADLHPADLAGIIADLDSRERTAFFRSLEPETAAGALGELPAKLQVQLLEKVPPGQAADILEEMPADAAADVVGDLPEEQARQVLAEMEREERADVSSLLVHGDETAGGLMTTDFVALPETHTVEQAIGAIRQAASADAEVLYYVYVVDAGGRLVGVVTLKDLLVAAPEARIADVMRGDPVSVAADASADEAVDVVAKYHFGALPVVDAGRRLLGIVTMDDVLRRVLADAGHRAG